MHRFAALLVVAAACGGAQDQGRHPPHRDVPTPPFEQLADETDGPPQQPVWPTLPDNIRTDLEHGVTPPADAAARLRDGHARLDHWTLDLDEARSEASDARLRAGLEGLYLVEPLAFAPPSPAQFDAAGLLQRFWAQLDRPKLADWIKTVSSLPVDRRLMELLDGAAHAMWQHFSALVLRDAEPKLAVDATLRDLAERKATTDEHDHARRLYELYIQRRGDAATADDWLDVATAEIRVDDGKAGEQAFERARDLASHTPNDRHLAAKLHGTERDLKALSRYVSLLPKVNLDAQLETLDLLRNLGRRSESKTLVSELKRAHPRDARVRTRVAAMGFEDMMEASGNVLQGEAYVADELADRTFENQDGDYWSMLIGAQGVRAMADALPQLSQNFADGARKMVGILQTTKDLTRELAKTRPGRAASLTFVVDRVIGVLAPGKTQDVAAFEALKTGLADAIPLRTQYPETSEADQLIYMLAMFDPDRKKAFAAIAQKPVATYDDDPELYLQRARAALTVVVAIATPETIAQTRAIVDEIPPSWDPAAEAAREAMLGDCDALDAIVKPDPTAWSSAERHYEAARTLHKSVGFRMANNLGFIAARRGDLDRANKLFGEAAQQGSQRIYIAQLNAIVAMGKGPERLELLDKLAAANTDDGRPPIVLSAWLAATATDPAKAAAAAKDALTESAFYQLKPNGSALGIDGEGVIEVGFGIASRKFFALNTKAYTNLWLTSPQPLTRAQLEALVKPAPRPKRR